MKVTKIETFEAIQWFKTGDHLKIEMYRVSDKEFSSCCTYCNKQLLLHGQLNKKTVCAGDWIITNNFGEVFICKYDQFEAIYEKVTNKGEIK